MTLHIPSIPQNVLRIASRVLNLRPKSATVDAPKSPAVGDVVLTRRGWYGEIVAISEKGYTLHMVYIMADGAIIRPGNTKQFLRRVWLSEVQS